MLAFGGYGVTQAAATGASGTGLSAFGGGGGTGGPPGGLSTSEGGPGATTASGSGREGTSVSAQRATSAGSATGTAGVVIAVSGNSVELRSRGGTTLTLVVTSTTTFKVGTAQAARSALKVGDVAMVVGSTSSDGAVTAKTVTFGVTPIGAPGTDAPKA
jgi:hypothetical protein